ncbi:MAG: universal stress protein [Pseudomonadales bacterium]
MSSIANILAVVQHKNEAPRVIDRARKLAQSLEHPVNIHALRVVYESIADLSTRQIDQSTELKQAILKAEESYLEDILDGVSITGNDIESATIWNRRTWEGVLHTATVVNADIIIKSATTQGAKNTIIRTPDDWNLLRHTEIPVLMAGHADWPTMQPVIAAVDVFDRSHDALNQKILEISSALNHCCKGGLHLVCVYPRLEPWLAHLSDVISYETMRTEIESDIHARMAQMSKQGHITDFTCHIADGPPVEAIEATLKQIGGGLLVIGTHARAGLQAAILGNTAESVLHDVNSDVVAVPC